MTFNNVENKVQIAKQKTDFYQQKLAEVEQQILTLQNEKRYCEIMLQTWDEVLTTNTQMRYEDYE